MDASEYDLALQAARYFAEDDIDRAMAEQWIEPGTPLSLETHEKIDDSHGRQNNLFLITSGCLSPILQNDKHHRGYEPAVIGTVFFEIPPNPEFGGIFGRFDVTALSKSTVWRIPRNHHQQMFDVPGFYKYMYRRSICTNAFVRNLLALHGTSTGKVAVARMMVLLSGFIGRRINSTLSVRIQQEYLGGLAGVTRRTANNFLSAMKAAGEIEVSHEQIFILDEGALLRHAELFYTEESKINTALDDEHH